MKKEQTRTCSNLELTRAATTESGEMLVEGYALKWDTPTILYETDTWYWTEEIQKGSLEESEIKDVVLNKNHNDNFLLARTTNETLSLEIDEIGLKVKAKLVNTTQARDIFEEIKTRLLSKMSFRWRGGDYEETNGQKDGREFTHTVWTKLKRLSDVSVVSFPAYDDTVIEAARSRSMNNVRTDERNEDLELKKIHERIEGLLNA